MASKTSTGKIYEEILEGILHGRFSPGQRLVEGQLMDELQVGRSTVREVLSRLSTSGVVTLVAHHGARIRRFSRLEVGDIFDILDALLRLGARRAAQQIASGVSGENFAEADDQLQQFHERLDFVGLLAARERFHAGLFSLAGNAELERLVPRMQIRLMSVQFRELERGPGSVQFKTHHDLALAVLTGNEYVAEAAAQELVRLAKAAFMSVPKKLLDVSL